MKNKRIILPIIMLLLQGCMVERAPTTIRVNFAQDTILVGESIQINYTISPTSASQDVYFTSDDLSVAVINGDNAVGIKSGITAINVVSKHLLSGKKVLGSAYLEVIEGDLHPTSLSLRSPEGSTLYIGEEKPLLLSVLPHNASQDVTWSSQDIDVARVNDGVVIAQSIGKTSISATSVLNPKVSASIMIEVLPVPEPIEFNFDDLDLSKNAEFGTVTLSTVSALSVLSSKSDGMIDNVLYTKAAYAGNGSSGAPYSGEHGLFKFGAKTEGPGSLHFTTKVKVKTVELLVADWGDQDGLNQEYTDVIVNGEAQLAPYKQTLVTNSEGVEFYKALKEDCKQWMTFEMDEATDTIKIDSKHNAQNKSGVARFRLFAIRLLF